MPIFEEKLVVDRKKIHSITFAVKMFHLLLLLQLSIYMIQDCKAVEIDVISKDKASVISTSSPIIRHLTRVGTLDPDVKVAKTVPETEILNKDFQNYFYKVHKDSEINQKGKDSETDSNTDVKENAGKKSVSPDVAKTDLSKLTYSKLASDLKNRLHQMIAKAFPKYSVQFNSSEGDSGITSKSTEANIANSPVKNAEEVPRSNTNEPVLAGRQFVFHPYLPYGKDVSPDEKISITDVLPVKMVKFFKGMVEEAPWEQMFMKMVRMIVDQFVDKIIEKMFSHKDDHDDEWRSSDGGSAKPTWSLPKNVFTRIIRSRRSTQGKAKSNNVQGWIEKDLPSSNRVSKEDRSKTKEPTEEEEESWLDSILDYLFPDDPKADDDYEKDRRRKRRDANQPLQDGNNQISGIMRHFLARYLEFHTEQLSPETMNSILKDSIRDAISETVSQDGSSHEDSKLSVGTRYPMSKNAMSDTSLDPESVEAPTKSSIRTKRSTTDDTDKDDEEERLWQANRRTRPSNRKSRDDCSLRRACNAGRLLSRLPSVQDITMQLKAYGNEPHWDALLWGMTKKRCSRIFCKRQRSPKGTKHHWDGPEKRFHRKSTPSSRSSRLRHDDSDLTTIYPV